MLAIKSTAPGMKNTFDGLFSRLNTAESEVPEVQLYHKNSQKLKSKKNKDWTKKIIYKDIGTIEKGVIYV